MKTSVALGSFDGLHKGHQNVLQNALSSADDGLSASVLLFDTHPQKVLTGVMPPLLLAESERDTLLRQMGFALQTVSFESIRNLMPEAFVEKVLCEKLCAGAVSCGYNYRFGRNGAGDAALLQRLCAPRGIRVSVCETAVFEGEPVSSTRIRRALENGEPDKAAAMLTRPFSYTAEVIHGNARGRELGYPTANQQLPFGLVVPKYGVYASQTTVQGRTYNSITNIGIRPTLPDDTCGSETHILGCCADLYGQQITVALNRYIRSERKFASLDEVFTQVQKDIEFAYGK